MEHRNGTGGALVALPARKRYTTVPEYRLIEIERPNPDHDPNDPDSPETIVVELRGWPKGPRCPTWVETEVEAANDVFRAAVQAINDDPEMGKPGAPTLPHRAAGTSYHRDLLLAVIEGLTTEDATVLCADRGPWEEILVDFGWWLRATPQQAAEASAGDPEAPGEDSRSPGSSPDSALSTATTTG